MKTKQDIIDLCTYANDLAQSIVENTKDKHSPVVALARNMHGISATLRAEFEAGDGHSASKLYDRLKMIVDAFNKGVAIEPETDACDEMLYAFKNAADNYGRKLCFNVWVKDGYCKDDTGFHLGTLEVTSGRGQKYLLRPFNGDINKVILQRYVLDVA